MDWAAARERLRSPIYAPLASILEGFPADRWPDAEALTAAAHGIYTSRDRPIRFVAPRERTERGLRSYELHIADTGEVETRPENWHDLFNALAWIAFPGAKAAINAQHAAILEERGEAEARRRSPERDALTLFDEGGVAVASGSAELLRLLVDFEWKELFWTRREALAGEVRFLAFGHALWEKALEPHLGIVAKTVFLPVDAAFLAQPPDALRSGVDRLLAQHFSDRRRFPSPRSMAPLPVLGIPGWHPRTGEESFYDDPVHFRTRRDSPRA